MLTPCDACGRHLRTHEARCPFCLAARAPASPVEDRVPTRSRAALVAATAFTLAGCPLAVRYGGPPPESIAPAEAPPPVAPARATSAPSDASTATAPPTPTATVPKR